MTTDKMLMGGGLTLTILMLILARVGTRSMPLFLTYIALMFLGVGISFMGQKMRDRR